MAGSTSRRQPVDAVSALPPPDRRAPGSPDTRPSCYEFLLADSAFRPGTPPEKVAAIQRHAIGGDDTGVGVHLHRRPGVRPALRNAHQDAVVRRTHIR